MPRILPVLLLISQIGVTAARAQTPSTPAEAGKATTVSRLAKGNFDVKVSPISTADSMDTGGFGRLALAKSFQGDLVGTSVGQMIASSDGRSGSGGYVALEKVTGTLHGRTGSFVLMHNGTMTPKSMEMRISVVPESGTGELAGIEGSFKILIEGKQHFWEFAYTLPQ
jgi:hypothetical protein